MNKKQKNKKIVKKSKRNYLSNRRYTSLTKIFLKTLKQKINQYVTLKKKLEEKEKLVYMNQIKKNFQRLSSILDKSVKKKVIHKNKAARKKSKFQKLINFKILA